ncbi:arrestin [Cercophora newfieldiana]|uniref:Arrestin n=1 Tax=Cercophora newfieldiana TaxID=92897 RepID=A0AA39Y0F3_9PEZI|nr:arrestin [Cercophora newfieldiana]
MPSLAGRTAPFPKSNIDVNLSDHYRSKIYSSSSPIKGDVTITTKRDVPFDSIQILLMGHTKSRVEGMNPHDVTHTFLKMTMPIPESLYPVPRILETGRTYTIPFNFVIPNQLTINACNHRRQSDRLQDHHVLLPPSMGHWEKDDMAPEMAKVEYQIKARVLREDDLGGKNVRIMEAIQTINVLPASVEEPPLNITEQDRLYAMHKTKSLRRNLLASKLGRLTATAIQPTPAVLKADGLHMASTPMAQVNLSFEPSSADITPPKISGVSGKVTAITFFSSGTISTYPNLGDWNQPFASAEKRGSYSTSVGLPPLATPKARWSQYLTSPARRDSGYASETNEESDSSSQKSKSKRRRQSSISGGASPVYHMAELQIPIALPTDKKMFIPTFHSCIASRVYTLHLSLAVSVGTATSTVSLTVPLQVAVEGNFEQDGGDLPSFEAAVEEAEADAHLRPRVLSAPQQEFTETSVLPGYA